MPRLSTVVSIVAIALSLASTMLSYEITHNPAAVGLESPGGFIPTIHHKARRMAMLVNAALPKPVELHYQCGEYDAYPHAVWRDCGATVTVVDHTPFKPDHVDTPNSSTEGSVVDDVPDELKLTPEQQKAVDSFKTPPLSAIAVTCNGMAVSLFIQIDADHLFRADPRQSDMFTAVKGKMVQNKAPPMEWKVAYALAQRAVLTTHVVVPCEDKNI